MDNTADVRNLGLTRTPVPGLDAATVESQRRI